MQQKEEKRIVNIYGVKYWQVPEEIHNSCEGCQLGTSSSCKVRENKDISEEAECGYTHTIYKIADIALGKKKRLIL